MTCRNYETRSHTINTHNAVHLFAMSILSSMIIGWGSSEASHSNPPESPSRSSFTSQQVRNARRVQVELQKLEGISPAHPHSFGPAPQHTMASNTGIIFASTPDHNRSNG